MQYQDYNYESLLRHCSFNEILYGKTSKILYKDMVVNDALNILEKGLIKEQLKIYERKRKKIIIGRNKESFDLLLSKTITNMRRSIEPLRVFERNQIVKRLNIILNENFLYKIYRLDLKSFYESFDKDFVLEKVNGINKLSPISKNLIKDIIDFSPAGIPRGLSLSSILSDILMKDFDFSITNNEDVFFYARFVDDIIIVSHPKSQIKDLVEAEILKVRSQKLNIKKYEEVDLSQTENMTSFSYLGYRFILSKINDKIDIKITIADEKIKKIKTRLVRTIIAFIKNRNSKYAEDLFFDRLKFLLGSYEIYDNKKMTYRKSGLRYNYPEINDEYKSLEELDVFLRRVILAKDKRTKKYIGNSINSKIRKKVLRFSFVQCYKRNTFFKFNLKRLSEIKECWKNE